MADTATVVTARLGMLTDTQLRSVTIIPMSPWTIALVRGCRVYLQSLVGFLLATRSGLSAAAGLTMPAQDFAQQLLMCASLAVAPATVSLIQNVLELLAKMDSTNPTWRA